MARQNKLKLIPLNIKLDVLYKKDSDVSSGDSGLFWMRNRKEEL